MAAEGEVEIYIEHERDMSAMKKVVKLLMTFNDKVTLIKFKVNSTVYLDMVYQRIHDWIEVRALIMMGKSFFLYFNVFFWKGLEIRHVPIVESNLYGTVRSGGG